MHLVPGSAQPEGGRSVPGAKVASLVVYLDEMRLRHASGIRPVCMVSMHALHAPLAMPGLAAQAEALLLQVD
jgi:hypothetical protein